MNAETTELPSTAQTTVDSSYSVFDNENGNVTKYSMPVLLVVGCLGNLFSFFTMLTKEFRTKSTGLYMVILAVVDTFSLVILFNEHFLRGVYQVNIPGLLNMCNAMHFLYSGTLTASAWIVAGMTFDRVIAVFAPIKGRIILTPARAAIVSALIVSFSYGIYIYALFAYESSAPTTVCGVRPGHVNWYTTEGIYLIFSLVSSIIPILLIFAMNIAIVVQLKRQTIVSGAKNDNSRNNVRRVTTLVLLVSTTFVVLTLPNNLLLTLVTAMGMQVGPSKYAHNLILEVTELMNMANHAINFFLYACLSASFRRSLRLMLATTCSCQTRGCGERAEVSDSKDRRSEQISSISQHVSDLSTAE